VPIGADTTGNSVTPAPTVSNSTTSNSTPTLEQLQQIINMLQQQIQQLIVLVQQKIQVLQQTATNCAKEGEEKYPNWTGYESKPHFCCSGLTSITNSFEDGAECIAPNDGTSRCTYCGDGTCGAGENKCNCPKDCSELPNCVKEGSVITGGACCTGLIKTKHTVTGSEFYTCEKADESNCIIVADLGGQFKYQPALLIYNNKLIITGTGNDNAVWVYEYVIGNTGQNKPWYSLGGTIKSGIAMKTEVSSDGSEIFLEGIGSDQQLWAKIYNSINAKWSDWKLASTFSTDTAQKFSAGPFETIPSANTNDPNYGYTFKTVLNNDKTVSIIKCHVSSLTTCGNNQCDIGENHDNCPTDCAPSDCNGYCKFLGFKMGVCTASYPSPDGDWVEPYAPTFSDCKTTSCNCVSPQKCMGNMPSPYCEKHGGTIQGSWPGAAWCQCPGGGTAGTGINGTATTINVSLPPFCGNGKCETGETTATCPADCGGINSLTGTIGL